MRALTHRVLLRRDALTDSLTRRVLLRRERVAIGRLSA